MLSYNDRTSLNADQNLQFDLCSRLLRLVMTSRLQLTEAATQAPQPLQAAARHGSITMVSPSLNFLFPFLALLPTQPKSSKSNSVRRYRGILFWAFPTLSCGSGYILAATVIASLAACLLKRRHSAAPRGHYP